MPSIFFFQYFSMSVETLFTAYTKLQADKLDKTPLLRLELISRNECVLDSEYLLSTCMSDVR